MKMASSKRGMRLSVLSLLALLAVTLTRLGEQCAYAKEDIRPSVADVSVRNLPPRRVFRNDEPSASLLPSRLPFVKSKAPTTSRNTVSGLDIQGAITPLLVGFRKSQSHSRGLLRDISTALVRQAGQSGFRHTTTWNNKPSSQQTQEPFQFAHQARGGSQVRTKKPRSKKSSTSTTKIDKHTHKKSHRPCALSASKPFFPEKSIGELTLKEVGKAFDYAVHSTREDFDEDAFMQGVQPRVKSMFEAMDKAAATSRGKDVKAATTGVHHYHHNQHPGDIDTFKFCAAARILSEWRLVRQVPEGNKRYASSMKMGNKDVVQNIGKMEAAAHDYIDNQKMQSSSSSSSKIKSPTLRDMLQFEVDQGYHPTLPKLKEVSGGMGLLWVRRQLQFQTATFQNLLDIPKKIAGPGEAFSVAYEQVYSNFHRKLTKKVFNYSFKEGPEIHEVYKCMNPRRLKEVMESPNLEDSSDPPQTGFRRFKPHSSTESTKNEDQLMEGSSPPADAFERRVWSEMEIDAHEHIKAFVKDIQPVLDDLAELFDEFNMNDPKKA